MYTTARLTTIGLTTAALVAAGCGAEDPKHAASKSKPAGMPVQQYVTQVAGLGQSIDDARSDYFHAEHTKAAIKRGTADVQAAYASAAKAIVGIDPPAVAAELHRRLADTWQKRASQLEKAIAARPLDTGRIDDLMAATGRDPATSELYTLPQ